MDARSAIVLTAAFAALTGTAYGAHQFTAEQVVRAQCGACHEAGLNGAPRIGDREAWLPRLRQGVDALVRAAMHGHGAMPARGGMAQLTDSQFRDAVIYLFNGRSPDAAEHATAAAVPADPNRKIVEGIEIILGVTPAEALRRQAGATAAMHGGVPKGSGYYHLNVSLHDALSHAEIGDAMVEARVASALSGETKRLEAMQINRTTSYGNYFRLTGRDPYTVTVEILRAREARPIQARFDVRR